MAKGDKRTLEEINKLLKDSKLTVQEEQKLQKEKISLLEKELDLKVQSLDLSGQVLDSVKELLGVSSKRTQQESNLLKTNKEINREIYNQNVGYGSIEQKTKEIAKNNKTLQKGKVQELALEKKLAGLSKDKKVDNQKDIDFATLMGKQIQSLIHQQDQINHNDNLSLEAKQLQIAELEKEINLKHIALDQTMEKLEVDEQALVFTKLNIAALEEQTAQRKKELAVAVEEEILNRKINAQLGLSGKLLKGIGAIPGLGDAAEESLAAVTEQVKESVKETGKLPSKYKTLGMITKQLGKSIAKGMFDPLVGITAVIATAFKSFKEMDASAGEFAKSQGLSYATTVELSREFGDIAAKSDDILTSRKDLLATQGRLSNLMGAQVRFSDEMVEQFTSLNKRLNMSEKTQEILAKQVLKTGKSAKTLTAEINGQVLKQNEQRKISMSFKEVQDAIGESSKSIQLTFKGNVKELVNQVSAAKALGTNLAGVENIASSLLDFESSIQAELEAELLLGQEINLEKARQAALQGDMATVADEVLKNTAIMNAFETKNVRAQEAAAKSLGMSRNDLAEMVKEQEQLELVRSKGFDDLKGAQKEYNDLRAQGYSAEEAALAVGDKSLEDQLESASVAERMEAIMTRIQEVFMSIADVILPIVDGMMNLVGGGEELAVIIGALAAAWVAISATMSIIDVKYKLAIAQEGILTGEKVAQSVAEGISASAAVTEATATTASLPAETTKTGLKTTQAVAGVTAASASTLGIGTVAIIAGIAAILGAVATYAVMNDGIVDSESGGYGKRKFFNKGEITSFNDNDNVKVVAGTNAKETTPGGGMSLSPLIAKVDQLIAINQRILDKSPVIAMNSNKVSDEMQKDARLVSA